MKLTHTLQVRVPEGTHAAMLKIASHRQTTEAVVVRQAVLEYLKKKRKGKAASPLSGKGAAE